MCAHYIKKIILLCLACLLYTHQHGYGRYTFLGSASVAVVAQYDTRSDTSLCRVVMPFHPINLKECKQVIFLSSEPLEHLLAMPVCLPFESVQKDKNAPVQLFLCRKRLFSSDVASMCESSSMRLSVRACLL